MKNHSSQYTVTIASLPDYEKVVAEIYADGKFVAFISQEQENQDLLLEFPSHDVDEQLIARIVSLSGFIDVLSKARDKLIKPS